jgi:thiamine-phosphate pyrophosphorylase
MAPISPDPGFFRERLALARLMLIFTPEACGDRDPFALLEAVAEHVDVIQVRPKPLGTGGADSPAEAAATFEWTKRVIEFVATLRKMPLVMVDDRVDVALALLKNGCAGVHLGQDDMPVHEARKLLGPDPLIGLSTHDLAQVVESSTLEIDYIGFGPIHATATKGLTKPSGAEAAWVATESAMFPVFAIGGIDRSNVGELTRVGRVAVSSAILAADDPARAAVELRELLLASE